MFEIKFTGAPARAGDYLLSTYPFLRIGEVDRYFKKNIIKINGKRATLAQKLNSGDVIALYLPQQMFAAPPRGREFSFARAELNVIYEDSNILVADKQAGIETVSELAENYDTLANRVLLYLYNKGEYAQREVAGQHDKTSETVAGSFTPAPCHRLDTGTSGIVVFAKTAAALEHIEKLMRDGSAIKKYILVSYGHPTPSSGEYVHFMAKNSEQGTVKLSEKEGGAYTKKTVTRYRTLKTNGRFALVEAEILTGRTHQIRAQFAACGAPVAGDSKYGDNRINRAFKLKYQTLCAYKLTLKPHDAQGEFAYLSGQKFESALPWFYNSFMNGEFE